MNIFVTLLLTIIVFFTTMIVHEIGHFVRSEQLGYVSKIGLDKRGFFTEFSDNASPSDQISIFSYGIFSGLIYLFVVGLSLIPYVLPALLVAYYFGIRSDLKSIKKCKVVLRRRKFA